MLYDDFLEIVGEFGRYQKIRLAWQCLQAITSGLTQLCSIFDLATPNHRCAIPGYDNDTYQIQNEYHSYLINQSIPAFSSCYLYNTSVEDGNITATPYKCNKWVYDTSQFASTYVTEFNLVCDDSILQTNAVMLLFFGVAVGYAFISLLPDIIGRKPVIVSCNILFLLSHALMIWTPTYEFLLATRFLAGLSMAGQVLAMYILGLELIGPNKRRFPAITTFFFWCTGMLTINLYGYLFNTWRNLHIAIACTTTVVLVYAFVLPESPRWLLTRGLRTRAASIMKNIARTNDVELSDETIKEISVPNTKVAKVKFWRIFTTPRLCIRTIMIYFLWFSSSMTYYGLILNLDSLVGNLHLNLLCFTILEIVSYLSILLFVDRLGRRVMCCGGLLVAAVCMISCIFIILYAPKDNKWLMTVFALTGQFGVSTSFAVLWFWTGEFFPTELRNAGTGTSSCMARVGSVVAPYIGLMNKTIAGPIGKVAPFIVFSSVCVASLTLSFLFLPETSRQRLPETIADSLQLAHRSGIKQRKKALKEKQNTLI